MDDVIHLLHFLVGLLTKRKGGLVESVELMGNKYSYESKEKHYLFSRDQQLTVSPKHQFLKY